MDVSSGRQFVADVDELGNKISKCVIAKTDEVPCATFEHKDTDNSEGSEEIKPCRPDHAKKCLEKSATFPCSAEELPCIKSLHEEGEDDEPETAIRMLFFEEHYQSPFAPSPPFPLVSAMKGSREKQGLSPQRLHVKWAPDVYDPTPTSVSHSVKSKQKKSKERDNNKKKGKKGNSSRGNGANDKKPHRRLGGKSEKGHKMPGALPSNDFDSFDIGSPDYYGSSFLKESVTKFHYSVAEAS